MNSKNTWIWIILAAGLFAFIFVFGRFLRPPDVKPQGILPGFQAGSVTSLSVLPAGQLEIQAQRTNHAWQLTRPVVYPARAALVENLLAVLERLNPVRYITPGELHERPGAPEEYGLDPPQIKLVLQQGALRNQVLIGNRTAPGDQVFLGVVGSPGVYVVDSSLLQLIPLATNDWRDPAFIDLRRLAFDHLILSNATRIIELQREPTNRLWRITRPMQVRADSDAITEALQKLQDLGVAQFVSDDPKADLERFGLQPAVLELAFASGTNPVAALEFGRSPTNDTGLVYARRSGVNAVVAVASDPLALWRAPRLDDFRDRHLLALDRPIDQIEVRGREEFLLQRLPGGSWRFASLDLPADGGLVEEFLKSLAAMQITQFLVATEPDLRDEGLLPPRRQVVLMSTVTNATGGRSVVTNAHLSFGTNRDDKVFARRADEDSVYAVALAEFDRLPAASWQLRERRIWSFTEDEVARLTIRQHGKVRELVRHGTNSWSLAPGSQGIINDFAVEEATHQFGELTATYWIQCGGQDLARHGFSTNGLSLTFELRNGEKRGVEFGGTSDLPAATVTLNGQTWVFEFPLALYYQFVLRYLTIPSDAP